MMSLDHEVAVQLYVPETKFAKGQPVGTNFGKVAQKAIIQIQRALPGIHVTVHKSSTKFITLCGQPDAVHRTCMAILEKAEQELTHRPADAVPEGERHYVVEDGH